MIRKALRISGIVLLVLSMLLLVLASPPRFLEPSIQPLRMLLVSVITKGVSRSLNGTLEIDSIQGSLLSAPVALGIRLTDDRGKQVVQIHSLSLDYRLADLVQGQLRIKELAIIRPHLSLAWDEQEGLNLAGVFPPAPSRASDDDAPIAVTLDQIRVRDGSIDLAHPSVPQIREISALSLDLRLDFDGERLNLELQRGVAKAKPAAVDLETLQGVISMTAGELQLDGWLLETSASRISATGGIPGKSPTASLQLELAPLDLGEIGRLTGEASLQGGIRGLLQTQGPADEIELKGSLAAGIGKILLSGALDTRSQVPNYQGSIQLAKLDLSDLIARNGLRSDINATIKLQGVGFSKKDLAGTMKLLIEPSSIGGVAILRSDVQLRAESERLQVENFRINTSAFNAALAGEIDLAGRSELDYQATLELEQLRTLLDVNALAGKANISGQVGGTWPDTWVDGMLEADGIVFEETAVQGLDLSYRIDGLQSGPLLSARLEAHAARFGEVEIEAATGEAEYAIHGNDHRARFSAHLTQSAAIAASLDGEFSSDGQRSEITLEQLEARLEDDTWNNTSPARVSFTRDGFLIEDFRLAHGDAFIESSGGLLDDQFQKLLLRASNIDLDLLGDIISTQTQVTGRGDLTANLEGSLAAPVLTADISIETEDQPSPLFEKASLNLSYAQQRLQGAAFVEQEARRVLSAKLELPINLALDGSPVDQRLIDTRLSASVDIDRPRLEALSTSLPELPPLAGTLQGRVEVAGSYSDLAIDTRLDVEGSGIPDMKLLVMANLDPERLSFGSISATTNGSELQGQGNVALAEESMEFEWRIPRLELREFVAGLPPGFPSQVSGGVNLGGTLQDPELSTVLKYADGMVNGDINLGLGDPSPRYQADLLISELDLARFLPELQGNINASVNIQGVGVDEDERDARIELALDSKHFELAPELAGRLSARLLNRSLHIDTLRLQSKPLAIQAQGVLSETLASDFGYSLAVRDLASMQEFTPGGLQVRGELDGRVSGGPGELGNVSRLKIQEWQYADWHGGGIEAEFRVEDLLVAPQLTARAHISGVQNPQLASTDLRLDADYQSDQGDFSLKVTEGPFADSLVAGQVRADRGVQVRLDPFRLQHDDWIWENSIPIHIASDSTGAVTLKDLNLANLDQRISVEGRWSPDGSIALEARAGGVEIKPVLDILAPGVGELDGLVDAALSVEGRLQQPQVDASLQTKSLSWGQQPLGEADAQISTSGPVFTARAHWTDQQDELLTLNGHLDRSASDAISVEVVAPDFDLSMLQHLSPEILHSDGRLDLDLKLGGSLNQPLASGTLELRDGELTLAALGASHTDIQSRLSFSNTRLDIEQMQIGSPTGIARLSGRIETAGLALEQVDLKLKAKSFTLLDTPALAAVISSDISVQGSGEDVMASGALDVVRSRLRYQALPTTGPQAVEPWELTVEGVFGAGNRIAAEEAGELPGWDSPDSLPFLRTDILVNIPGNSWVQGSGTAVEIGGDLRVKKALERPFTLAGEVRTLRGFATFFGRRFNVNEGQVRFTGAEEIEPILNVEASHQVSGYTAYVRVTGSASEPEISFHSEPELSESDVISLLVFGRTSDQLSSSEQNSLSSQARSMASQLAAGALERTVGETLGLNSIAIDTGNETSSGAVGVGRYIGQDLFLFYERTFRDSRRSNRSGNTVGIEKRLNERQNLRATGSDLGESSIDWLWQYEY